MKTNYHTHSTFCDGKNSPEEILQIALEKKFNILGFSSHSMYPYSSDWHLASLNHKNYSDSIEKLKEKYKDKIEILKGFEADYIPGFCSPNIENFKEFNPDFIIGSVHFVMNFNKDNNGYFEADGNPYETKMRIQKYFKGNINSAIGQYFYMEKQMLSKCNFTILGHADLIKKQNAKEILFDENSSFYKNEIKSLAKEIKKWGGIVEVNTGGITRNGMKEPYPSQMLLELLNKDNIPVTITSDCHNAEQLDFYFTEAKEYIKKAGYTETAVLTGGKIIFEKI